MIRIDNKCVPNLIFSENMGVESQFLSFAANQYISFAISLSLVWKCVKLASIAFDLTRFRHAAVSYLLLEEAGEFGVYVGCGAAIDKVRMGILSELSMSKRHLKQKGQICNEELFPDQAGIISYDNK